MTTETEAAEAQAFVEQQYPGDGVTGVATERDENGEWIVKVFVDKKRHVTQCARPVEKYIETNSGEIVRTKVVEVGEGGFKALREMPIARAAAGFDRLYNKIVGGLQISTGRGQDNWVGTLGGIFMATINGKTVYGGLTNAHVTGLNPPAGMMMCQPDLSVDRSAFSRVAWVSPFKKSGGNLVDTAILDCDVSEGWWENNRRWTVHPEQFGGFKLSLKWRPAEVGMEVVKWGRTTGITRGTCVSVNASDSVDYGSDGVFSFVNQCHFRGENNRDMSAGGDSGSFIVHEESGDVVSHLFAGGGGITIGYNIGNLIKMVNGRFCERPPVRN